MRFAALFNEFFVAEDLYQCNRDICNLVLAA